MRIATISCLLLLGSFPASAQAADPTAPIVVTPPTTSPPNSDRQQTRVLSSDCTIIITDNPDTGKLPVVDTVACPDYANIVRRLVKRQR